MYREQTFCDGEVHVGKVIYITDRYAILDVCGCNLPLETCFISWSVLLNPVEILSLGDKMEVVVQCGTNGRLLRQNKYPTPKVLFKGCWLNRLPLIANPWPAIRERYQDGSVVEVEIVDQINCYIARARMPEGVVIQLSSNEIYSRTRRGYENIRKLQSGERIKIVIRSLYCRSGWIERFMGNSTGWYLADAGYVTPAVARNKLDSYERSFIEKRNLKMGIN